MRTEFRYALRLLLNDRSFAATVVLSLALGIGANTAIFSLIDGILLRAPNYRDPGRLISLAHVIPKFAKQYPLLPTNIAIYQDWRKHLTSIESLGIARDATFNLTGAGRPEQLNGAEVSSGLLGVYGVQPRIGRDFTAEEERTGHNDVVILADSLWRRQFHADPGITGRKILLDGKPKTVVGVLPPDFFLPEVAPVGSQSARKHVEILQPVAWDEGDLRIRLGDLNYWATARLKPGVTLAHAQAELNVIAAAINKQIPGNFELHATMIPLVDRLIGQSRQGLLLMMAAVAAVLLVLVVNLANLSLARAAGRAREAAIRTALGASRGRLMRQSLAESLLLAAAGGAVGILLAWWGVNALVAAAPLDLPRLNEVHLDWRVLLFALGISVAAGVAFGVLPAARSAMAAPIEALKSGSRGSTEGRGGLRVRNLLVSVEVGLSAALLVTAGLLIASFTRVMTVDRGFQVDRVLALNLSLLQTKYQAQGSRTEFFRRVLDRAAAIPGVQSASLVSALPLSGEIWIDLVSREHDTIPDAEMPATNVRFISPDYFRTLRVGLRDGRTFEDRDRKNKVTIVSASLARRLWGAESPIGRKLSDNGNVMEVIGVTPDFRSTSLDHEPVNMLYLPYWDQRGRLSAALLVRTAMDPKRIVNAARAAIWETDSEAAIPEVRTLEEVMSDSVAQRRFQMMLVLLFAAAAMALAGIGTYGVLSYAVTRRTNEMGIRMALGAGRGELLRMVLRQGMLPVFVGLAGGALTALWAGRYLGSLLYQVSPHDPVAFAASAGVLLAVSVAACLIPARRATRVNPLDALRFE